MEIVYLDSVDSTHTCLKNYIQINGYKKPLAIITQSQTNGIGSRDNNWEGIDGNLFFSFVIDKNLLPNDLPLQSSSIYFSYILKQVLKQFGSQVIVKWPNDFYCKGKKIGGTITTLKSNLLYCGIGLNLLKVNGNFGFLDIKIDVKELLGIYFNQIEKFPLWKQIISDFKIEFYQNKDFMTHIEDKKILLNEALLQDDGSLLIDGKKVYSSR